MWLRNSKIANLDRVEKKEGKVTRNEVRETNRHRDIKQDFVVKACILF